jgi:hypothetical protein
MSDKEPVLLVVLIETAELRWYVAGIRRDGTPVPLVCSEPGNMAPYVGQPFDEQASFLRHRLAGVLQRGCDRLWGRQQKPSHIVFLADATFAHAAAELTQRVATHFVEWMTRPPVVFLIGESGFQPNNDALALDCLAGELEQAVESTLRAGLPALYTRLADTDAWELSPTRKPS